MICTLPLRFEHDEHSGYHYLRAFTNGEPNPVGVISWRSDNGMFLEAWTHKQYRRLGIATALWDEAVRRQFTPPVQMTANQTDEGHAWASTLGTGVERQGMHWDRDAALRGDY